MCGSPGGFPHQCAIETKCILAGSGFSSSNQFHLCTSLAMFSSGCKVADSDEKYSVVHPETKRKCGIARCMHKVIALTPIRLPNLLSVPKEKRCLSFRHRSTRWSPLRSWPNTVAAYRLIMSGGTTSLREGRPHAFTLSPRRRDDFRYGSVRGRDGSQDHCARGEDRDEITSPSADAGVYHRSA